MSRASIHILKDAAKTFCGRFGQDTDTKDSRPLCGTCIRGKDRDKWVSRFWEKVDKSGECWVWTSAFNNKGYGVFNAGGRVRYAHRISVVLSGREIPEGLVLDHLCRRPLCVNPEHLEVVTQRVNMERSISATKTICKNGHPFSDENTYRRKDNNGRMCRSCHRERMAAKRVRALRQHSGTAQSIAPA